MGITQADVVTSMVVHITCTNYNAYMYVLRLV